MLKKTILSLMALASTFTALSQEKAAVDYSADLMTVRNKGEYTELIGNVIFYHNGAVITCDTAYKYNSMNMRGVGNVVINQDSTYIYGDSFTYDGDSNIAKVYSPLIKTIDGDAIMYTRNMEFNTKTNIGLYTGGGTISQKDNIMESKRGEYYASTRNIILYDSVAMKNDDYRIKTDSIGYNMNNEVVTFFTHTNIWNHNGEFLSADRGNYDRSLEVYNFTRNAYVVTKEQELWADTMTYNTNSGDAVLYNNIQGFDSTQNALSFGDFGLYKSKIKEITLTKNPSVIGYDNEKSDTTYMSADTMLVYPALIPGDTTHRSKTQALKNQETSANQIFANDSIPSLGNELIVTDSLSSDVTEDIILADTSLTDKEKKSKIRELRYKKKREEIDKRILAKREELKLKQAEKDSVRTAKEEAREEAKAAKNERREKKLRERGLIDEPDHDHDHDHDHEIEADSVKSDTSANLIKKRIRKTEPDSSDNIIRALGNVRIFKSDMQAICGMLESFTMDSTMHLSISPIVWSDNNQITSNIIHLFTEDGALEHAELDDFPIMAQEVEPGKYNQIKGKQMEVTFKDNEIDYVLVDGNAETIFYKTDSVRIEALYLATAASMIITFDSSQISVIKWYVNVETVTYPIEKVTPDVVVEFEGFKWNESLRPKTKEEIFNRIIRPSKRKEVEELIPPLFSITESIEEQKKKLIEGGLWYDRNEQLSDDKSIYKNKDF